MLKTWEVMGSWEMLSRRSGSAAFLHGWPMLPLRSFTIGLAHEIRSLFLVELDVILSFTGQLFVVSKSSKRWQTTTCHHEPSGSCWKLIEAGPELICPARMC